jgi:hypothetical protein
MSSMAPTTRPGLGEDLPTVSTLGASQHLLLSCHFFTHHRDPIVAYLVVKRCSARVEALSACSGLTLYKWACHKPNSSFVLWRLHGYCHTHEGFGHALLGAGELVNSTFVEHPGKRTWAVRRLQISTKEQQVCVCVSTLSHEGVHNCVQNMRFNCSTYSTFCSGNLSKPYVRPNPHFSCGLFTRLGSAWPTTAQQVSTHTQMTKETLNSREPVPQNSLQCRWSFISKPACHRSFLKCYSRRNLGVSVLLCDFWPSKHEHRRRFFAFTVAKIPPLRPLTVLTVSLPLHATLLTLLPAHNPWQIYLQALLAQTHTGLKVMMTSIAQVNTTPLSPPSAVCDPNPATHPDKVDIIAALHTAFFVDAYRSHSGCPLPPNPCQRPRAPRYSIAQEMYQHIFDRGGT